MLHTTEWTNGFTHYRVEIHADSDGAAEEFARIFVDGKRTTYNSLSMPALAEIDRAFSDFYASR